MRVPSGVDNANEGKDGGSDSGVPGGIIVKLASLPLLNDDALSHRCPFASERSGDSGMIRKRSAK